MRWCNQRPVCSVWVNTHDGFTLHSIPSDEDKHTLLNSYTNTLTFGLSYYVSIMFPIMKITPFFFPIRFKRGVCHITRLFTDEFCDLSDLQLLVWEAISRANQVLASQQTSILPFHWSEPPQSHSCLHNLPNHPSTAEQFLFVFALLLDNCVFVALETWDLVHFDFRIVFPQNSG